MGMKSLILIGGFLLLAGCVSPKETKSATGDAGADTTVAGGTASGDFDHPSSDPSPSPIASHTPPAGGIGPKEDSGQIEGIGVESEAAPLPSWRIAYFTHPEGFVFPEGGAGRIPIAATGALDPRFMIQRFSADAWSGLAPGACVRTVAVVKDLDRSLSDTLVTETDGGQKYNLSLPSVPSQVSKLSFYLLTEGPNAPSSCGQGWYPSDPGGNGKETDGLTYLGSFEIEVASYKVPSKVPPPPQGKPKPYEVSPKHL